MQATRYFSGTDRDVLAPRPGPGRASSASTTCSRKLTWSEWAALSTSARVAEAQPMAERYLARWGDDPRPQVRAAAHTLFGVDEWTRGRIRSAIEHLDRGRRAARGRPATRGRLRGRSSASIAHAFGLYCHAAHGDHVRRRRRSPGSTSCSASCRRRRSPAVCAFGAAVAAVHTRWDAVDRLVRRALELDPAAQFAFFGGQLLMFRGLVEAHRGDYDAGWPASSRAAPGYRAVGGRSGIASYQALLAELLAQAGRVNDAAELVAGARLQTDESGEGWNEVTRLHRRRCGRRRVGRPGARRRAPHHGSRHRQRAGRRRARRASRGHPRSAAGRAGPLIPSRQALGRRAPAALVPQQSRTSILGRSSR